MDPKKFYIISKQIHKLLRNDDTINEIGWRTIANRIYYYLYHIARNDLSEKLHQDPFFIDEGLLGDKFSHHKKVIRFYEHTSNLLRRNRYTDEADYADENKDILEFYLSIREVADYNIGSSFQSLNGSFKNFPFDIDNYSIDFENPSEIWERLLTSDPPIAAEILLKNNDNIISGLKNIKREDVIKLIRRL